MNDIEALFTAWRNYGSGVAIVIAVFLIVNNIIKNPAFIAEVNKTIIQVRKPNKEIDYGNYKLFKLKRTLSHGWTVAMRIIGTFADLFILSIFGFLNYLIITSKPRLTVTAGTEVVLVFLLITPIISLLDIYASVRSSLEIEVDGDYETLMRFLEKKLFDIGVRFNKFDVNTGEIGATIYGCEMTIKVEKTENLHNKFIIRSKRRIASILFYSAQYGKILDNLIRELSYDVQAKTKDSVGKN